MASPPPPIRVGFLATASIATKNYRAVVRAPALSFAGIASRELAKAAAWLSARGAPPSARAFGSYEELLADPAIDAVYMPLPTALHAAWVPRAIAAGKHVLLEKPCALSLAELESFYAAARAANVVLWDGVMFSHSARLPAMRAALDAPAFGRPTKVVSAFSFAGDAAFLENNIRVSADGDPLGCVGDLGWYNVRFALFVFRDLPASASAVATASTAAGVPHDVSVRLVWADGRHAHFDNSVVTAFRQFASVASAAATLELTDFVLHADDDVASFTVTHGPGLDGRHERVVCAARTTTTVTSNQEVAMWQHFGEECAAVRGGAARDATHPRAALDTQAVVDAIMVSLRGGGAVTPVVAPRYTVL